MSGRVDGKIALISGAGSGLGQATAIHLAREGARIVATDIDGGTAEATAASINGEFQGAAVSAAHDVTSQEQWVSAVDLAASHFGGLDIVVDPYSLATTNLLRVTANTYADVGVRHAESFAAMLDALTA